MILFVFLDNNSYFCGLIQILNLWVLLQHLLGLIGNIIVGILGSVVGYWLLGSVFHVSLGEGWIPAILTGAIGAIVILFLINLIFKKK